MLPAFSRNQGPREAPVAIARSKGALGFFERMDLDLAEAEPLEQRRQVHAGERLHERLVVPPGMAEMDQLIERLAPGQEVEVHHPGAGPEQAVRLGARLLDYLVWQLVQPHGRGDEVEDSV